MLAACGSTPPGQAPLSEAALAAVTADAGAPKDQLARSIDDLFTMPGLGETRAVVEAFRKGPHIFNLGHGITPDANPDNVQLMIDTVRNG